MPNRAACIDGLTTVHGLICMVNGDLSGSLMPMFFLFILASIYSFFNPTRVTGIDAIQSNAAMVGLMGAATLNIVFGGAGIGFFFLYMLLAFDCMASFSTYFSEHSQQVQWGGPADPLRVILDPKGGNDGDYSRL